MLILKSFILSQTISLFGIGDTSDAGIAMIVAQTASQLEELRKLLKVANKSSEALNESIRIARKAQDGIDQVLRTKRASEDFQNALKNIKNTRSLKDIRYTIEDGKGVFEEYEKLYPKEAKSYSDKRQYHDQEDQEIAKLDDQRIKDLKKISADIEGASPGRAEQLQAALQVKLMEELQLLRREVQILRQEESVSARSIELERQQDAVRQKRSTSALKKALTSKGLRP